MRKTWGWGFWAAMAKEQSESFHRALFTAGKQRTTLWPRTYFSQIKVREKFHMVGTSYKVGSDVQVRKDNAQAALREFGRRCSLRPAEEATGVGVRGWQCGCQGSQGQGAHLIAL